MSLALMAVTYSMAFADDRASELLKRAGERYATLAEYDMEYTRTEAWEHRGGVVHDSANVWRPGANE